MSINQGAISRASKDPFVPLRESYVAFCGGSICAAMVLALFEYRYNGLLMHKKPENIEIELGHSAIVDGIFGLYQRAAVSEAIKTLSDKKIVTEIENARYLQNKSKTYTFNPEPLNLFLQTFESRCSFFDNEKQGRCTKIDTKRYKEDKDKEESLKTLQGSDKSDPKVVKEELVKKPIFARRKPSIYGNNLVKDIFEFWNNLEINQPVKLLTQHKADVSIKTFQRSIIAINKTLQKHSSDSIKQAMSDYLDILYDSDAVFAGRTVMLGMKVSLPEFFKFSLNTKERMHPDSPLKASHSWFNECIVGYAALQLKFAKFDVDNNPKITEVIKKEYKERIDSSEFKVSDINNFIRSAKRVLEYHRKNSNRINWCPCLQEKTNVPKFAKRIIDACLSSVQDKSIIHTGWLSSDKMFDDRLTKYLVKIGLLAEPTRNATPSKPAAKSKSKGYDPGYKLGEIE